MCGFNEKRKTSCVGRLEKHEATQLYEAVVKKEIKGEGKRGK